MRISQAEKEARKVAHLHAGHDAFCGSRVMGRRFVIDTAAVTCRECLARISEKNQRWAQTIGAFAVLDAAIARAEAQS